MLYITLAERVVERCNDLTSNKYQHVTKMAKKIVDSYLSNVIPHVGDTICLEQGCAYDVVSTVYHKTCASGHAHDEIFVEVIPHVEKHKFSAGAYSFEEDWPLIIDLETESDEA